MSDEHPALKIIVIIQARMASTRLPGKSLMPILNQPTLQFLIERLRHITHPVTLVIATSEEDTDEPIVEFGKAHHIEVYRGSEEDVLDRFLKTARRYNGDVIVRITGDCPLMDPRVVDQAISQFLEHYPDYDYVSNTIKRTFPRGLDVEVFKRRSLERAHEEGFFTEEREHVTPFIWRRPEVFSLGNLYYKEDHSSHRWTLDTEEDFKLLKLIIEELWPINPQFTMEDVLALLDKHPEWVMLNAQIKQKGF